MARLFEDAWKSVRRACAKLFRTEHRRRNPGHYLHERYGMDEKPPGWNDEVLGYFHGPEEGRVRGPEFSAGFAEAARKPPVPPLDRRYLRGIAERSAQRHS